MKQIVYSVWYGTIRANHFKLHGAAAVYFDWAKAQEYCEMMNEASRTDKFMVVKETLEPVKEKKK